MTDSTGITTYFYDNLNRLSSTSKINAHSLSPTSVSSLETGISSVNYDAAAVGIMPEQMLDVIQENLQHHSIIVDIDTSEKGPQHPIEDIDDGEHGVIPARHKHQKGDAKPHQNSKDDEYSGSGLDSFEASSEVIASSFSGTNLKDLWDNGVANGGSPGDFGLITHYGTAPKGADSSVIGPPATLFGCNWSLDGEGPDFRRADDFTVSAPGWIVNSVTVFGYITDADILQNPFGTFNLNIWRGAPGEGYIVGSTSTFNQPTFTNIWRQSASNFPGNTQRGIFEIEMVFQETLTLEPGQYWIDVQHQGANVAWMPLVTLVDSQGNPITPSGNSLYLGSLGWTAATSGEQGYDLPFVVQGSIYTPPSSLLFDNSVSNGGAPGDYGLITHHDSGPNGSDVSVYGSPATIFGGNWTKMTTGPHYRRADDFYVEAPGWVVNSVTVFGYITDADVSDSPFGSFEMTIWSGTPGEGYIVGSTSIWNEPQFANIWRQSSTNYPGNTQRGIFAIEMIFPEGLSLEEGQYWIDVQHHGSSTAWMPMLTLVDELGNPVTPNGNSILLGANGWEAAVSGEQGYELPFMIEGSVFTPPSDLLLDNGIAKGGSPGSLGLITHPESAPNGTDASVVGTPSTLFGCNWTQYEAGPHIRRADDFTVDAPGWSIDSVTLYGYVTDASVATNPFGAFNLNIWNGHPGQGDIIGSTSSFTSPRFAGIWRQENIGYPDNTQRGIYAIKMVFEESLSLEPGQYWIDVQHQGSNTAWMPPLTLVDELGNPVTPNGNSLFLGANGWETAVSGEQGYDLPFTMEGSILPIKADTVSYQYDLNGNITEISYPNGTKVSYVYDALNQQTQVIEGGNITNIFYDAVGNRIKEELPNGTIVSYAYDSNNRLTEVEHELNGVVISKTTYTLDNIGNRLTMTDEQGRVTIYSYDSISQLTGVQYPDASTTAYTYDPVGNRLTENGVTYTYDAANQLIQVGETVYTYDENGNLLSDGEKTYQYDCENRLIACASAETTTTYTYDGDGNRLSQTTGAESYQYIYDINKGLPELIVEINGEDEYLYIHAGRVISQISPNGQAYYNQDGLGSTVLITGAAGDVLNRYEYDAFGTEDKLLETIRNPFLFTGEPYDQNGLIFLRTRYYNPATGRFLTRDTYLGTLNDPLSQHLYIYVGNNPVLYVDPSGHLKVCEVGDFLKNSVKWQAKNITYPVVNTIKKVGEQINLSSSIGINLTGSPSFWTFNTFSYLSTDTKGNVAIQRTLAGGPTTGTPGYSISIISMHTNASTIDNLNDLGFQIGGSVSCGLMAGVEANIIPNAEDETQPFYGITRQVGLGSPGAEVHVEWGKTDTIKKTEFNVYDVIQNIYIRILGW